MISLGMQPTRNSQVSSHMVPCTARARHIQQLNHVTYILATFSPVSADAFTTVPRLPIYKLLIFDNI